MNTTSSPFSAGLDSEVHKPSRMNGKSVSRMAKVVAGLALTSLALTVSANAAVIVPFNGIGSIISPNDGSTSPSYTAVVMGTQGNAQISYTITITTNDSNDVSTDAASTARGFGKVGQSNNALNMQGSETLEITFSSVSAVGLNGWSVSSNDVAVRFDSFDLVNNGANPPTIQWDIAGDGFQSYSNAIGSGGGNAEAVDVSAESGSTLTTQAVDSWMWVDNIQTSYTGSVTLIPEPSALGLAAIGLLGLLGFGRRRKR